MKQIQPNLWINQHKANTAPDYWVGQPPNLEGPYDSIESALSETPTEDSTRIVQAEAVVKPVE